MFSMHSMMDSEAVCFQQDLLNLSDSLVKTANDGCHIKLHARECFDR